MMNKSNIIKTYRYKDDIMVEITDDFYRNNTFDENENIYKKMIIAYTNLCISLEVDSD